MAQVRHSQGPTMAQVPNAAPTPTIRIPLRNSAPSASPSKMRNSLLSPGFSPSALNNNGSYEIDRVLKSGYVYKRTRRTKSWKSVYLILRPASLSIYNDENETKLREKLFLADLSAVANLKDPKNKRQNLFGVFSPSRNYHFGGKSEADAREWVEVIRREAHIDEDEEEMLFASPAANATGSFSGLDDEMRKRMTDGQYSSSPDTMGTMGRAAEIERVSAFRRLSNLDYSGNEPASLSDMSDSAIHMQRAAGGSQASIPEEGAISMSAPRELSEQSGPTADQDPERVIWQGHLLYLKSKSGMRQWKNLWAVVRARSLALYKDNNEYAPVLVIPLSAIVNAVEVDPISKTKTNCFQVITEERSHRFCAHSEEMLDNALGAFKCLLAKRKEDETRPSRS